MLLRFAVSNHRSVLEPIELSLIAIDEDRAATRSFDRLAEQVLTIAGIYGPNASGKSNVLEALAWLSRAVATSVRQWEDFVPREPHRFGSADAEPSWFDLDLMVDGIRYEYRLEVDSERILHESLHSFPERRRRMIFERDENMEISFRRGVEGQGGTRELLTPTTLALSAASRYQDRDIRAVARSISRFGTHGVRRRRFPGRRFAGGGPSPYPYASTTRLFDQKIDFRQERLIEDEESWRSSAADSALALLRFADLGIDDVKIVEDNPDDGRGRRRVQLVHGNVNGAVAFELDEESEGTQTWFRLIGPALLALEQGHLMLFDEIDSSLHPRLSARLLELFQDPMTNPRGAQLIFTTHDTSLLGVLNRDEVWLTEKSSQGATTLTALADYRGDRVRKSTNLEKAYLQGRFGAVPELDQARLRRALGLASASD